ncbi:MAG: hypothetical protein OEV59_08315 [Deltaproteobacteria bacterium]|nr:hypothetical protein [Deltaproteobacteria bacterium]
MKPTYKAYLKETFKTKLPAFMAGGLISAPLDELVKEGGFELNALSTDPSEIVRYALLFREKAKTDNLSIPYIMTVESEAYGGESEQRGTVEDEHYPFDSVHARIPVLDPGKDARMPLVADVMRRLKPHCNKEAPLIADVAGPFALATSVTHAKGLLTALKNSPEDAHAFLDALVDNTLVYAGSLGDAGADTIFITENFASYLTVGPGFFEEFGVRHIGRLVGGIKAFGMNTILHLCGDVTALASSIQAIGMDAVSVDNSTDVPSLVAALSDVAVMGNVCAETVTSGPSGAVVAAAGRAADGGVSILSSACGIDASCRAGHIAALFSALNRSN